MVRFEVGLYMTVIMYLEKINSYSILHAEGGMTSSDFEAEIFKQVEEVKQESKRSGFDEVADQADRILTRWRGTPVEHLAVLCKELMGNAQQALLKRHFFHITPEEIVYYRELQFSPQCARSYPGGLYDMMEAGKCIAVNRDTASVFHSMRVLELGLRSICDALQFVPKNENWHAILRALPPEIQKRYSPQSGVSDWKDWEHFYSEAVLSFRHFKNAWRNYVVHGPEIYRRDEAVTVLRHTVSFMDHIAERLTLRPVNGTDV